MAKVHIKRPFLPWAPEVRTTLCGEVLGFVQRWEFVKPRDESRVCQRCLRAERSNWKEVKFAS